MDEEYDVIVLGTGLKECILLKRDADEKANLLLHAEERRNDALLKSESCKGDKVTLLARIGELDDKLRLKTQEIEEAEMKRVDPRRFHSFFSDGGVLSPLYPFIH
ncbi:hypothetical protein JHK86_048272 [Glycine max]|nr:hypothetical protein JHK86_048272 [Glycine max]